MIAYCEVCKTQFDKRGPGKTCGKPCSRKLKGQYMRAYMPAYLKAYNACPEARAKGNKSRREYNARQRAKKREERAAVQSTQEPESCRNA